MSYLATALAPFVALVPAPLQEVEGEETRSLLQRDRLLGDVGGLRSSLAESGVEVEASLIYDGTMGVSGGADTAEALRGLFDLNIAFDMETLAGIEGAMAFVDVYSIFGEQDAGVGNLHGISNIDADVRDQIAEIWWEQLLADDRLRVKVGKLDANSEYAWVEHGEEFIGPAWAISNNVLGIPTYPETAFSFNAQWTPDDETWVSVGVYDGASQSGRRTGQHGLGSVFGGPGDLWLVLEAGRVWNEGRFGVGLWSATGDQDRFTGGTEDGTEGFYLVFDQLVYQQEGGPSSAGLFARYAWADPEVSEVEHHLASGVTWSAPFAHRPDDACGLAASLFELSGDAGFTEDREALVEAFYRFQATPAISLKPDVQWVMNPGGDASLEDAWVLGLRVEAAF